MGVPENINWLKENREGARIFRFISKEGGANLRELREVTHGTDWWPVKAYVKSLIDRGLIEAVDDSYRLTKDGQKVYESLMAIGYLEQV